MRPDPQPARMNRPPATRWLVATRVLLAIAAVVDGYLLWVSGSGGRIAGCGPESNCHAILSSRWAYWFDVPVSAPALLIYTLLFTATFWLGQDRPAPSGRRAWQVIVLCSVTILGSGLWFVGLQLFVLKRICPYCMAAHTCGMGAAALLLWQALLVTPRPAWGKVGEPERLGRRDLFLAAAGALPALAVLILVQALYEPKVYLSNPIQAGVTTNSPALAARQFQIFDGQFQFQLNQVPLIGKIDAAHVMVSLFDYTCHHCRQVHPVLLDASRQFSNQLAIVSLPMPLDGRCNPRIRRTQPPHTNACALARIGLTVWTADRKKSAAFDDWVFAPETAPVPSAAEAYARQLVGPELFDKASTNAWIDEQLRQDVSIYAANYSLFHKTAMPQAIIGTNLISGVFSRDQLFQMLSEQFGL